MNAFEPLLPEQRAFSPTIARELLLDMIATADQDVFSADVDLDRQIIVVAIHGKSFEYEQKKH